MTSVIVHRARERSDLPLVLLPPFPVDAGVYDRVLTLLTGDVITVDPPGFGGAVADGEPSLEEYVAALLTALDEAGVGRFVVAGNSMGGYAAMALADQHPERLAGIGLLGTKSSADTEEARATRLDMAEKAEAGASSEELVGAMREKLVSPATRDDDAEAVAWLDQRLAAAPPAGIAWAQRAMSARPDRTDALRALAARGVPAVVVHGAADPMMGAPEQDRMAQALDVTVVSVPDRGHLLPLEAPRECAAALSDLWDRARVGS